MSTLYEITKEIEQAMECDEDGVLLPEAEARFNELQISRDEKFENIAKYIKNLTADIESIKAEKVKLDHKRKMNENKIQRLKNLAKFFMDNKDEKKMTAGIFTFSVRSSESVEIEEWTLLSDKYTTIKITPNKTELKKFLETGGEVDGVSMVKNESLSIR